MKNSNKDDIFKKFSNLDDNTVEEISQIVPFLDSKAKERIARECERKIHMKDNKINNQRSDKDNNYDNNTVTDKVEVYHSKWYRSAIAAAACFVLIVGVAAGGAVIKSNRNIDNKPYITQTQPPKQTVITSETPSQSTKENKVIITKATDTTQTAASSVPEATNAPVVTTTQQPLQTTEKLPAETTAAASQSPYIDEDIIRNLIKANRKCGRLYIFGDLEYSFDNPIIQNGSTYYPVTDPEYSSFKEIENYIRSVYTSDAVDFIFNIHHEYGPKYADIDGKLCINSYCLNSKGYNVNWDNCRIEIISCEGDTCTFKAIGDYIDPGTEVIPEDYPVTQTLLYENGSWKLQQIFS